MYSQFEDVSRKKKGSVRENSLFHFVNDWYNTFPKNATASILDQSDCRKGSGYREVYYISLRNKLTSDQNLIAGFVLVECHLSVDKNYSLESATSSSDYFTASHIKMVLKKPNTNEGLAIRVYFNQEAQPTSNPIRLVSCTLNARNQVQEQHESPSPNIKMDLSVLNGNQVFQDYKSLLNSVTKEKNDLYIETRSLSYQVSRQLEQEVLNKDWFKAKNVALQLQELANTITRYNDRIIDGRAHYLDKLFAFYDQLINRNQAVDEHSSLIKLSVHEETLVSNFTSSKSQPSLDTIAQTEKQCLEEKIIGLVDNINLIMVDEVKTLAEKLAERHLALQELNESCLILSGSGNTPADTELFIQSQRNSVVLDTKSLYEHFNTFVDQGDIEQVKQLHGIVSDHYDLKELYSCLLGEIFQLEQTALKKPSRANIKQKVVIAQYFYECCPLYRSFITVFSYLMIVSEYNLIRSSLLHCFVTDNSDGFKMLLAQGISLDGTHLINGDIEFNALQTIIFLYPINPKPEYIKWAIENGASTTFSILRQQIKSVSVLKGIDKGHVKKSKEVDFSQLLKNINGDQGSRQLKNIMKSVVPLNNALKMIVALYKNKHPELLELMIPSTPCDQLIVALLNILNCMPFRTVYFFEQEKMELHEIDNTQVIFENFDTINFHIQTSPRVTNDCYIPKTFYYVSDSSTDSAQLRHYSPSIFTGIKSKFQNESFENQQKIMLSLLIAQRREAPLKKNPSKQGTINFNELVLSHLATKLAYEWISTHTDQYLKQWMVQSFEHICSILNNEACPQEEFIQNAIRTINFSYRYFLAHLTSNGLAQILPAKDVLKTEGKPKAAPVNNVSERNPEEPARFFQAKPHRPSSDQPVISDHTNHAKIN